MAEWAALYREATVFKVIYHAAKANSAKGRWGQQNKRHTTTVWMEIFLSLCSMTPLSCKYNVTQLLHIQLTFFKTALSLLQLVHQVVLEGCLVIWLIPWRGDYIPPTHLHPQTTLETHGRGFMQCWKQAVITNGSIIILINAAVDYNLPLSLITQSVSVYPPCLCPRPAIHIPIREHQVVAGCSRLLLIISSILQIFCCIYMTIHLN